MANILSGKQMLAAKIIIFQKRFNFIFSHIFRFVLCAFASNDLFFLFSLELFIKNSPQSANPNIILFSTSWLHP